MSQFNERGWCTLHYRAATIKCKKNKINKAAYKALHIIQQYCIYELTMRNALENTAAYTLYIYTCILYCLIHAKYHFYQTKFQFFFTLNSNVRFN